MLIAQISDMHVLRAGTRLFGALDTFASLARCVEHVNRLPTRPDAVLVTGDMTNDGDVADYEALVALLDRLAMPYYPIPSNHDDRERVRWAFRHLGFLPTTGPLHYTVEHLPIRLIALDTVVPGHTHGHLGEAQLAWLEATLRVAPDRPTIVFLHHPPFPTGIDHMDAIRLTDADALGAVITRHAQVERVACGHLHRVIQVRWAGYGGGERAEHRASGGAHAGPRGRRALDRRAPRCAPSPLARGGGTRHPRELRRRLRRGSSGSTNRTSSLPRREAARSTSGPSGPASSRVLAPRPLGHYPAESGRANARGQRPG